MQVRPDAATAAGVERETRGPRRRRVVAVAPLHKRDQRRAELTTLVGDDVLRPAGTLRVGAALEHALVAQQPEAAGERVRRDPEAVLELLESGQAQHGVAKDQQRPALSDGLERPGDRAHLLWVVALEHGPEDSLLA